jgi:hypothetical protein
LKGRQAGAETSFSAPVIGRRLSAVPDYRRRLGRPGSGGRESPVSGHFPPLVDSSVTDKSRTRSQKMQFTPALTADRCVSNPRCTGAPGTRNPVPWP